ncbi:hypothetical protein [Deinococcus gobiensis]|uniref:Uncharacterized protein n=1 Tax=Deinococcus gobiensis (strain DSM 21396 / JCM 16679 / CGMCC 1.7299 / I-0) TaxID=745776 RepID=H8H2H4_DEIGI|nr:hypothetical protein DGo_PB0452 [Deinococcus gobiensis I-0]
MRKVWTFLTPIIRPLVVLAIYGLVVCAYGYSSILADLGDTVIGPPVVQEALRAFIAVQIGRALWQRWGEFNASQRWLWGLVAVGVCLNLARGHFSATPLTLSFFLLNLGLVGISWRLMAASRREVKLSKELVEARTVIATQDAELVESRSRIAAQDAELTEARAEILRLKGAP